MANRVKVPLLRICKYIIAFSCYKIKVNFRFVIEIFKLLDSIIRVFILTWAMDIKY